MLISKRKLLLWKNCALCVNLRQRRTALFTCPVHSNGRQSRAVTPRRFEGRQFRKGRDRLQGRSSGNVAGKHPKT